MVLYTEKNGKKTDQKLHADLLKAKWKGSEVQQEAIQRAVDILRLPERVVSTVYR